MGNERSHLAGLEVDDDAIEVTEHWSMYSANFNNGSASRLSVFISPMFPGLSKPNSPSLIQAAKNLMVHRHPCILKYVSTWSHGGRFHLATEEVRPLSQVLDQQTSLQICLGLHSILKALVFLHEKAQASHNNVCRAAIYVSPDGTWKLGGFEFLCLFRDLSVAHLQQIRAHRYERAVPPEEDSSLCQSSSVDQYAFGVLVNEVLKGKFEGEEELQSLTEFRDLARRQLQNTEPSLRPSLAPLLNHQFFSHQFLHIHSFLVELPLKSESERQNFFRVLPEDLKAFPAEIVASQLAGLLLGRMVLLDSTAQHHLLPALLTPCSEGDENMEDNKVKGIFTLPIFRQHLVPRLIQMMCVRDAQIRLLLLSHFQHFLPAFSQDQLRTSVLPELLVGIKDTSDVLVSMTLRALADMVPILGASIVIGGKRGKLFTDGRPKPRRSPSHEVIAQLETPTSQTILGPVPTEENVNAAEEYGPVLPERLSPDGGEAEAAGSDKGEEEAWSDWDVSDIPTAANMLLTDTGNDASEHCNVSPTSPSTDVPNKISGTSHGNLPDITTLDIKNLTSPSKHDEIDFFQDMEPVISKPPIMQVDQFLVVNNNVHSTQSNGLFDVTTTATEGEAWGDDLDWGLDEETNNAASKSS